MGWTRDYAFLRFQDAVRHVWRNADFVLPVLHMESDPPHYGTMASLSYPKVDKPRAIDDVLIQRARAYYLRISDKLLEKTDDEIWGILIHEAVHIGIAGHGAEFRRLVIAKGGVLAADELESGGVIKVQKKIGTRFQTVREFPKGSEAEATAWGKAQIAAEYAAGDRSKWRLQFGDVEDA